MDSNTGTMPGAERDEETGRYQNKYPREHFLEALEVLGGSAGTSDVLAYLVDEYDRYDNSTSSESVTYKNLRRLYQDGIIDCRKVGGSNLWMLKDDDN
jgi:hypothetical protein